MSSQTTQTATMVLPREHEKSCRSEALVEDVRIGRTCEASTSMGHEIGRRFQSGKQKPVTGYLIREATSADCQVVYDLICEMEETELPFKAFRCIYFKQVTNPRYECLVYEEAGRVLGMINIRYESQLHHAANIAEIMECAVDASVRSKGIGKLLFNAACEHARNSGCIQIEVACNQLREKAHRFYEREGMNNFHFKFSKQLTGKVAMQNAIGL